MSIPRRGEGRCPGPPRPRWGGGPDAPRMGDAPRGEQGEETQPLFRGGPGAIPTTRVSNDDTRDLTETPGWAIPEGQGSPEPPPPKGEGCSRELPGGRRAPRAERGLVGARQAERRQCPGGAGLKDIHHPPGQSLASIGSSGTRGPPPTGSMVGGNSQTRSVPVSPSHPGTSPRAEGRGLAEGSQLVGWVGGGTGDQWPGSGRGVRGEGEPGPERRLPASDPILLPLD